MAKDWTVVIPVKRLGAAKSRLRGAVPDARHEDLALAMVRDTVAAALGCAEVADRMALQVTHNMKCLGEQVEIVQTLFQEHFPLQIGCRNGLQE